MRSNHYSVRLKRQLFWAGIFVVIGAIIGLVTQIGCPHLVAQLAILTSTNFTIVGTCVEVLFGFSMIFLLLILFE